MDVRISTSINLTDPKVNNHVSLQWSWGLWDLNWWSLNSKLRTWSIELYPSTVLILYAESIRSHTWENNKTIPFWYCNLNWCQISLFKTIWIRKWPLPNPCFSSFIKKPQCDGNVQHSLIWWKQHSRTWPFQISCENYYYILSDTS
jgi:hypothetical protein